MSDAPRPSSSRPPTKGPDEYSDVLGMTPREHERKMRKWYVMLAVALFFAVFGEGFLMLSARWKEKQEAAARQARGEVASPSPESAPPASPSAPAAPDSAPPTAGRDSTIAAPR